VDRIGTSGRRLLLLAALACACLALPASPALAAPGEITTFAGTGTEGFEGDGGQATAANLSFPWGLDVAGSTLYLSDSGNHKVRRVSAAGEISTFAGTGVAGFGGDDGPATSAQLHSTGAVAADGQGNVYISDFANNRVRRVSAAGQITTYAGTGTAGYSGDGGPADEAELNEPRQIALDDAGNLLIADSANHRVRVVEASSGEIETVAGNGSEGSAGDGGQATAAELDYPSGIALAGSALLIADPGANRVRRVSAAGQITAFAGTGTAGDAGDGGQATAATLADPYGLAVDQAQNVYISDAANDRVRRVSPQGQISAFAGTGTGGYAGDGGQATAARLDFPHGLSLDASGNLFIADSANHRVRVVAESFAPQTTIDSGPAGTTNDPTPTFAFSSTEAGSDFECRLDTGAFAPCASPHTTAPLADGPHTFQVRATDPAGNTDPSPAERNFNLKTASVGVSGSTLVVSAAAARDNLRITRPSPSILRVSDLPSGPYTGAGLRAGPGCQRKGDRAVNCAAAGIALVKVSAGDRADRVQNSTPLRSVLHGGAGNDLLIGGPARETLIGGPGANALEGMGGGDLLRARNNTSDTLIDCGAGNDKAELDRPPKDPSPAVKGCETRARA
jgi:hypothetical protein